MTTSTRDQIAKWYDSWRNGEWEGDKTPDQFLREYRNVTHAEVRENGDLYVEDPQVGHYLDDDAAIQFVAWLQEQGAL